MLLAVLAPERPVGRGEVYMLLRVLQWKVNVPSSGGDGTVPVDADSISSYFVLGTC